MRKVLESPAWRLVIYIVGLIFLAGTFYARSLGADAATRAAVDRHTQQIDAIFASLRDLAEAQSRTNGDIAGLIRALEAESQERRAMAARRDR